MTTTIETTRYAMIDSHTGYVWGIETAESPVAACRQMDYAIDPSAADGRDYEEISQSEARGGRDCYYVYDATTLAVDAQRDDAAVVQALPFVGCVGWDETDAD